MREKWIKTAGGIVGLGMMAGMLFANQLGLDNNSIWGAKRYVLFLLGAFLFAAAACYRKDNFFGRAIQSRAGQTYLAAALLFAAILPIYVWFVSIGYWTSWRNETSYYDLLAAAFSHGRVALEIEPDPALLALEEPYEPANRKGIPVLWDATFYKGKYHIYWGPAPALLLALVKPFYTGEIGDKVLTFAFLTGTFAWQALFLLDLWKRYFFNLQRWAVLMGVAFAGLVCPMPYILVEGRIYEASIISGQFFLTGGIYWLYAAFHRPSWKPLAAAGLFLALAAASRTTLVPSVAFLGVVVFVWAAQIRDGKTPARIAAFAAPLLAGALAYGWYNYARFDSFLEFGLRYQLTSYNFQKFLGESFSPSYIPPNLYKSLLNALETRKNFPYIFPTRWTGPSWLVEGRPRFYMPLAEGITGILISSPFMLFAAFAGLDKNKTLRWTVLSLAGASLTAFLTLQAFFFLAMRYLLDLIPALSMLAVLGFWQALAHSPNRSMQYAAALCGLVLCAYSVLMSLLLSLSGNLELFKLFNPALLKELTVNFNFIFHR
jgi:hypothetical protein